ncbi:MAG: hypothetical protein ACJASY_002502 [Halioglobus sp.]|jgi:hypothetical protein
MLHRGARGFIQLTVSVLFLCLCSSASVFADDLALRVVGNAYGQGEKELLYREYHYCSSDALQCKVEYRDDSDELITHKMLDYRQSLNSPELFVKAYREEVDQSLALSNVEELVVDAGFDNFVRSKWEDLVTGEAVIFPFQPLGFDKPFKMRAMESDDAACDRVQLCLTVRVDSWLLGLLASPIELVYSRDERRLLRFSGVSNIRGVRGESLNVDIDYLYFAEG